MKQTHRKITLGMLAHVDAGKTTLSEAALHLCGVVEEPGRVDHGDAFLDTVSLERQRGITIFSKEARMTWGSIDITLLDTPGHVDFSAEAERTLPVLDYAVLVISSTDGVQGHTETLWELLGRYEVPVFLFVNKMDLPGSSREGVMEELQRKLSSRCVDFSEQGSELFMENVALCQEELLEQYLETGKMSLPDDLISLVADRKIFPCFFGSALKLDGVREFLDGLEDYTTSVEKKGEFGARVFKISRDSKGTRLTHIKVTRGSLRVRESVGDGEKVNEIRLYSGEKYETTDVVCSGDVCVLVGPDHTYPGQGLGGETEAAAGRLEPVLNYGVLLSEGVDSVRALKCFRQLEEEDPKLHVAWEERLGQIFVQPMGEVQLEIIQSLVRERFGFEVQFGDGQVLYRETIKAPVEGVGHFEPLRHYAEVHLLLEPLPAGSGLEFAADCSEDRLDLNWQRLVLTHLAEKEHLGVLTGSPITDMRITLVAGKSHLKHTEGGDFRQAAYRAVRQGLMEAESILLEPCYGFRIEVPRGQAGRTMSDLKRMSGEFELQEDWGEMAVLTGICPVAAMKGYAVDVASYTRGRGRLSCWLQEYRPCHNAEEVIRETGYDPVADLENTGDSVFCSHGSGYVVKWDEVKNHMHVESPLRMEKKGSTDEEQTAPRERASSYQRMIDEDKELEVIFERTFGPVKQRRESAAPRVIRAAADGEHVTIRGRKPLETYVLVDGYNIIFAWEDLKELSKSSLDAARNKLMDILCNYQGYTGYHLILVFDAYKVKGNPGSVQRYHNINVVYTKEAETADMYIEKTTKRIGRKQRVRVATSDGLEQMIILGHGATRISAHVFREEIDEVAKRIKEDLDGSTN